MNSFAEQLLTTAYNHYKQTGELLYQVKPLNPQYLLNVLNSVQTLVDFGYITDVSDNLFNDNDIQLSPLEEMFFSITPTGIEYVRTNR